MSDVQTEARPASAGNERHKWYIVHAYSNFEKKVAEAIRDQARSQGLEDRFSEILVADRGCGRDPFAAGR
jgi:transcriptional antiterminator NusG